MIKNISVNKFLSFALENYCLKKSAGSKLLLAENRL